MTGCNKDCFANDNGRCSALEKPYEGDCPFQKRISRMMALYQTDSDFSRYVNHYMSQHPFEGLNLTLITAIVVSYGEEIIKNKGLDI